MKGIVFTEFSEMVEEQFGEDMMDTIIEQSQLPSGGIYTSVGTYDYKEILQLVTMLSSLTNIDPPKLVFAFGEHLYKYFSAHYPAFFEMAPNAFDFLLSVESYIHVEVKKLYPDAELPHFDSRKLHPDQFEMIYRSTRPFADVAEGLITACCQHYDESITIQRTDIHDEKGTGVRFLLTKQS
ncbi:MAG: heme NO-binding domain-containing protein [Nitrospirales bacterium]|nr:heme NO-binding domain-containing protein [Nitrospira sp.]MDR4500085.1 heme NO-binding domain-containing protein [Nitrospirales bacterium]